MQKKIKRPRRDNPRKLSDLLFSAVKSDILSKKSFHHFSTYIFHTGTIIHRSTNLENNILC